MAFQPIVNTSTSTVFAHEALVRGVNGEGAAHIFEQVNDGNRYLFDQTCRVTAIEMAATCKLPALLSINFMPNAVYRPELCIRTTLEAADTFGFSTDRLIFEITEGERVDDIPHLRDIVEEYRGRNFLTAIDDFGAGYAGLNLLAEIRTDLVKLDIGLIRDVHLDKSRRAIVRGIVQVCEELGTKIIAEGIETAEQLAAMKDLGVELFQGYYFARPAFESLPVIDWHHS